VRDLTYFTHKRHRNPYAVGVTLADCCKKLLQFREAVPDTMVVLTVDSELEVECIRHGWWRDVEAVYGSKDPVERLWLVGIKTCPELADRRHRGHLVLNIYVLVGLSD